MKELSEGNNSDTNRNPENEEDLKWRELFHGAVAAEKSLWPINPMAVDNNQIIGGLTNGSWMKQSAFIIDGAIIAKQQYPQMSNCKEVLHRKHAMTFSQ